MNITPVMFTDPSGESFILLGIIIGTIIGAAIGGTLTYSMAVDAGYTGWDLAGLTTLGVIAGGLAGGLAGYSIVVLSTVSFTLPMGTGLFGFGGAGSLATTYVTITGTQILGAATIGGTVLGSYYMFAKTNKRNGYWAEKYINDHDPNHVHFKGTDGSNIRIDEFGNPLKGEGPLNAPQRKALKLLWEEILKLFKGVN